MRTRKTILLASCAVLLVICIVQRLAGNKNTMKTLSISDSPDRVEISSASGIVVLKLDGSDWYVGTDNYKVEPSSATNVVNCIKDVKILDTVSTLKSDDYNAQYNLDTAHALTITAKKGGNVIRVLKIGKGSSTGGQSYVCVGEEKAIYLVSGNYHNVFNKSEDAFKSMNVYNIPSNSITAVEMKQGSEVWRVEKTAAPATQDDSTPALSDAEKDSSVWTLTKGDGKIDSEKVASWVTTLSNCVANRWLADSEAIPGKSIATVKMTTTGGEYSIELFEDTKTQKDDDGKETTTTDYYAKCNKTSHNFAITDVASKKFKRTLNEL